MAFIAPTIQPEHGYVILVIVFLAFVNLWAGFKVGSARKQYNIKYPQMYAEKGDKNFIEFNCVQRAHQNLLENIPLTLALLVAASIYRPVWAASAGLVRVLGFVVYVIGYSTGDPAKRNRGAFGYLGLLVILGLNFEAAYRLITAA